MIRKILAEAKSQKGFTLIELLVVIAIIAILTVVFLPTIRGGQSKARDAARKATVSDIIAGIEKISNGDLAPGVAAAIPDGNAGVCLDFSGAAPGAGGTIGVNVKTAMAKVPSFQAGTILCKSVGGIFYRSYLTGGAVGAGSQVNYVVVAQTEGDGNVYGAAIPTLDEATALMSVQTAFNTFGAALTRTTTSGNPLSFYAVTK